MNLKISLMAALTLQATIVVGGEEERRPVGEISLLPVTAPSPAAFFQIPITIGTASESMNLLTGKSLVVTSERPLTRVSVTDPAIASATIVTPSQVLIHGHQPGAVTLVLWDDNEEMRFFDLSVSLDVTSLQQKISELLGGERVQATASGASVVLTGTVSSVGAADRAVALAQAHSANVVNLMTEVGEQVMLHVRFAEVDRAAIQEFGFSLFSMGAGNTIGSLTTGQFGQGLVNAGAVPADTTRGRDPDAPNLVSDSKRVGLDDAPAVFGLSDLLNVFLFRPDLNLGVVVRALEQQNLLEILAEPNLVAQSGREASFLAGGEFPFPVVQGISGGLPAVTIEFREFGIRLNFTPTVANDGTIQLKIANEVSALDFGNALTISGFVVPALSTRKAETEVQLMDGQSFAIAGLMDNRLTEVGSKIPWLGDIPVLGKLFQSRSKQRNNQELLVLITPEIVEPIQVGAEVPGPEFPKPFLDREEFDRKNEGRPQSNESPSEEESAPPAEPPDTPAPSSQENPK
ncbi:MAG TPA: pilus assembly protein N-terminal domain-containing protein [Vicinamibacteria bacterium]|nr:pilus assembly protein N-terminal domain-containing protein [Vicinamibacteria bacterium]